jgi:hypothetical protein
MKTSQRSIWLMTGLGLLCTSAALVTLRAAEQKASHSTAPATAASPAPARQAPASGPGATQAATTPSSTSPAPAAGSTSKPPAADGTTIHDDPTVAPDPQESADNNVSFPVDI